MMASRKVEGFRHRDICAVDAAPGDSDDATWFEWTGEPIPQVCPRCVCCVRRSGASDQYIHREHELRVDAMRFDVGRRCRAQNL